MYRIYFFSITMFLFLTVSFFCKDVRGDQPKILAVIIGVADYSDAPLVHVRNEAKLIKEWLENTYDDADVRFMLDDDASEDKIRDILDRELPELPTDSLFVFYFAGHGERGSDGKEPLYLRLADTTHENYKSKSIRLRSVVEALKDARRINSMILIDCCFSGGPNHRVDLTEFQLVQVGVRAFMLTSSWSNQISEKGYFSRALRSVWDKHSNEGCLQPRDLHQEVFNEVYRLSETYMDVQIMINTAVGRCIASMGEPSCLLIFRFPKGCTSPCVFDFSDDKDKLGYIYDPQQNPSFIRQVSIKNLSVKITTQGVILGEYNFDANDLSDNFKIVEVDAKEFCYEDKFRPSIDAFALLDTGSILKQYGQPSEVFTNEYKQAALLAYDGKSQELKSLFQRALDLTLENATLDDIEFLGKKVPSEILITGLLNKRKFSTANLYAEKILNKHNLDKDQKSFLLSAEYLSSDVGEFIPSSDGASNISNFFAASTNGDSSPLTGQPNIEDYAELPKPLKRVLSLSLENATLGDIKFLEKKVPSEILVTGLLNKRKFSTANLYAEEILSKHNLDKNQKSFLLYTRYLCSNITKDTSCSGGEGNFVNFFAASTNENSSPLTKYPNAENYKARVMELRKTPLSAEQKHTLIKIQKLSYQSVEPLIKYSDSLPKSPRQWQALEGIRTHSTPQF